MARIVLSCVLIIAVQLTEQEPLVPLEVNKCCSLDELMVETENEAARCRPDNSTSSWSPVFSSEDGMRDNIQLRGGFNIVEAALPDCGARQQWRVYEYPGSSDRLVLLENGRLRHFVHSKHDQRHYDYEPHLFCMDHVKLVSESSAQFAIVCHPETIDEQTELKFIIFFILHPVLHALSMTLLLATAIVYFIIPQLRDLLGNMVTTLCLCLVVVYSADLVRLFRGFSEHVSFLAADIILHISLLATFFWLNSMGYYIWRTFRSRNVFLRVTDKRKYCYYSCYAWGCTFCMATIALFSHFILDADTARSRIPTNQRTLGWLGLAMFFTPIAFTVLVNVFFYLTTAQAISRIFEMFLKLFLVLGISWMCMLMSWLRYSALLYVYIVAMALQGPLVFYICVCQRRVLFLLRKSFCSETCIFPCCRPPTDTTGEEGDWGEEMMNMTPH
ncbi:hypothetical protein B566_EDAN001618 [Ephemera danica]|nr:hypothetical protein B566_EDAN001618 [Ephemera danica]